MYKFVLDDNFHQTLKISWIEIFSYLCALECDNTKILFNMNEFLIWMNINLTPLTKHISNTFGCNSLKCYRPLFSSNVWSMFMIHSMECVCSIGHGVLYELIRHSLMGGCSMINIIFFKFIFMFVQLHYYWYDERENFKESWHSLVGECSMIGIITLLVVKLVSF